MAYWVAQEHPWRIEPRITEVRQRELTNRRAIAPDIERGRYPFRDVSGAFILTRADGEWLLATHARSSPGDAAGPIEWKVEKGKPYEQRRKGLDLRGASLHGANLERLPLVCLVGGLGAEDW